MASRRSLHDLDLGSTIFGQRAMRLDSTGSLAELAAGKGKPGRARFYRYLRSCELYARSEDARKRDGAAAGALEAEASLARKALRRGDTAALGEAMLALEASRFRLLDERDWRRGLEALFRNRDNAKRGGEAKRKTKWKANAERDAFIVDAWRRRRENSPRKPGSEIARSVRRDLEADGRWAAITPKRIAEIATGRELD